MFKKIAIVAVFLAVTAGLGYLLYRFFFGAPAGVVVPPGNEGVVTPGGGLPTAGGGRPTGGGATTGGGLPTSSPGGGATTGAPAGGGAAAAASTVIAEQASSPALDGSGNLNYYDAGDGRFYRVQPNGTLQRLSAQTFPNASDITWSPAGNKAALTFPDNSKIIYDFAAQKQVTLPSHWEDIAFNDDGSMIVAKSMGIEPANRWLVSAASDGTGAKLLEPLGQNGDKVVVSVSPDASVVAFSDTADPVGFDARDMLVIGQNRENFPALRVQGFGFTPNWSPDGSRLLYSAASQIDGYRPSLWIVDGSDGTVGGGRRNLSINTWADKCVFQGESTLYCAVPNMLPDAAGLERSIADTIPDNLVKIDIASGSAAIVGTPPERTSIRSMIVSPDGSVLYYVDSDGVLRELPLR